MKNGMKVLLGVIGIVLLIVMFFVSTYNKLVKYDEAINAAWAQIENVLQRRGDLIPNLVNTVKGYAKHEKEVFENVANARAALAGARTVDDKVKAAGAMDSALSRLLAIAENYPQLKANESFNKLMDELSGTENRIAVERKKYNEVVQAYNTTVRFFPANVVAGMFGFAKKEIYFKAEEEKKAVPAVNFN
ncbi:MAG TPA: LemA family protein [Candidatus Goldiibacteriota bacterium]|nr:LemA family protein [Candidatus Goldiibacteriota bacterium]HPN64842.1 LemA family protein [Candidatus Goldiibacteriota bacterium]HRQ43180.1 LemA family protein [Candidatus Goldiibacteriota bacterium]